MISAIDSTLGAKPAARDHSDAARFASLTGLRKAQAEQLRWADVDWKRNCIELARAPTPGGLSVPMTPQRPSPKPSTKTCPPAPAPHPLKGDRP